MASLQARSALRSTHPLLFLYKLISVIGSIALLAAGWVTLCYVKNLLSDREATPQQSRSGGPQPAAGAAPGLDEPGQAQVKRLSKPVKLVYSCATDREFYHTATHIPRQCERTALSEEAAFERNLKPCNICMKE
ncbi:MAG TPA: hypothetical protein VKC34_15870 [Blastocatellia bacterium]|nr:hypothetical protein [Blastocatellia bacterium]